MRSSLRVPALVTALLALSFAPACSSSGGGDDDDTGGVDATPGSADANPNAPDAQTSNPPDAMTTSNSMIGDACTVGETPQGSCSAGFVCVGLDGGAGAFCTKQCTGQTDPACAQGYTGAGLPICLLTLQDPEGVEPDMTVCIVMCTDNTGSNICTTCDGTCPGSLGCHDTGSQWSGCY